jgi:hypothetical protein
MLAPGGIERAIGMMESIAASQTIAAMFAFLL